MRRLARRSDKRRRILREGGGGAAAAAAIGSRVFPLRTPPPALASMPTVGTRRSTRVFVPKQQLRSSQVNRDPERVLRSGRRFALSKDDGSDWLKVFDGGGSDLSGWWKDEGKNGWKEQGKVSVKTEDLIDDTRLFGTVYSRKRRRSSSLNDANGRHYGIVFERRRRKKLQEGTPLVERTSSEAPIEGSCSTTGSGVEELYVAECSKTFAANVGIFERQLWSRSDCGPLVLAVFVDSSLSFSWERFERFLISVVSWMRRARIDLMDLLALTSCRSIAGIFSASGVHFLPVRQQKRGILDKVSDAGCGFCMISGAREFVPLLFVNFSALPSFFKSLHANIIHRAQHLPGILRSKHLIPSQENSLVIYSDENLYCNDPLGMESSGTDAKMSETPALKMDELQSIIALPVPISLKPVLINNSSKLRKHQKKRRSLRSPRSKSLSSTRSPFRSLRYKLLNNSSVLSSAKPVSVVSSVNVKQVDSCLSDLISSREESDSASSSAKLRKSTGKMTEKVMEHKPSLVEVRQSIDTASCNANILVVEPDRCWREDGAQVMLDTSGSHEWFIAVKKGDVTRFRCKPQDWRPCVVVNRYTHCYMWSSDDGWKLEFFDKWDWYVFKELHAECRSRNSQEASVKIIPVPGVREVPGYEEDTMASFVRPETYIRTVDDEVGRTLASEKYLYDMEPSDEDWLRHLNSDVIGAEDGCYNISDENFENIIYTLEKNAYNFPDDTPNKERALDLCQGLGRKDVVSAIYDYWLNKRTLKKEPVIRVFQGQLSRRTLLFPKPVFRKKRSFKRLRSQTEHNQAEVHQVGKGKPYIFLQAEENQHKYQAAEADAIRCSELATSLRTRAQTLMLNADLAAYKAAMALRIAETIRLTPSSESRDLDSCFLLD